MINNNWCRLKSIWSFGKKYLPMFIIAEVCILVSYVISVLLPLNLSRLIDEVLYGNQYDILSGIINNYVIMFLVSTLSNFIYAFVWQYLSNHYVLDVKNKIFEKVITAKASFLLGMNSGDVMMRIDGDSEQFLHVVQRNVFHFINSCVMCIGIVVLIARINLTISIMTVIAAVLPILLTNFCGRFTEKYSKETCEISGRMVGKLYEIIKGFREIKIFKAEKWAERQILSALRELMELGNCSRRIDFLVDKGINLINLCTNIIIYGFSVYLVVNGKVTIGLFLAVNQYIGLLHKKFNWMLKIYLDWYGRKVSIDRVNEMLAIESEESEGIPISHISSIEFKNVGFSYNTKKPVLEDVSFKINKGERIGIVGASGNGKTTIISLLLSLYEVNAGMILVNGIPLYESDLASLRNKIGIVSQEIVIFEDSIRYNMNLSKEYSNDEINKALKSVKLSETVDSLADGIDTVISPYSHSISGGQKQRLMIARAILKNPEFIIMDEATSALDIETEKTISEYLNNCSENTTMLIISHRLESLKNCDRILVLNNHRIEASGTHETLLESSSTYIALFGGEN